jgi:hypothetical protein
MQIKNRIEMLEKAIIDSGVVTGVDLGLSKSIATETDGPTSDINSFSTPDSQGDLAHDFELQNLGSTEFDLSPVSLVESNLFANQDYSNNRSPRDFALDQETSPLPYAIAPSQQFGGSDSFVAPQQFALPWLEPSTSQVQSLTLMSSATGYRGPSRNCGDRDIHSSKVSLVEASPGGQSKKMSVASRGTEVGVPSERT